MSLLKKTVLGIAAAAVLLTAASVGESSALMIGAAADSEITDTEESFDVSSAEETDDVNVGGVVPKRALTGFTIKDGVLTRYTGSGGYVIIPEEVVKIGNGAFKSNAKVTSVHLGENITEIGENAFKGCKALETIEMSDSVVTIGKNAFSGCVALKELTFGGGVKTVGDNAFEGCTKLQEINFSDDIESIGFCAFSGCTALKTLVIPDSVISVGARAFEACTAVQELTLGSGIAAMGENVFSHSSELRDITMNDGITVIGNGAFSDCPKIEEITIPDSVVVVGNNAFEGCYRLKTVSLGEGVEEIGSNAFSKCSAIREITLPDSVEKLGDAAFKYCSGIGEIAVPDGVTAIGDGTFSGCSWLRSVTIPDSVEKIGVNAFSDCLLLEEIELPASLVSIDKYAFAGCIGLKVMDIPGEVTSIGAYTFSGCTGVTNISVPASVKTIGAMAFEECKDLKDIDFDGTKSLWNDMTRLAGGDLGVTTRTSVNCTDGTINPKKVIALRVKTAPTVLTYYVRQTLILDGGEVIVTYSNGDTEVMEMTDEMIYGKVNIEEAGTQAVLLVYEGCTANFKIEVKDFPKLEMDNKSYDTFEDVFKEIGTNSGTYTITLNDDIDVTKLTFPKNADIIIKGNRHTIRFVGVVQIACSNALTFENVRLASKTKAGADNSLTISCTAKDLTLNDLLFTGTTLSVKGGTKNVLNLGRCDEINSVTGFSAVVVSDSTAIGKTLSTTNLRLGEASELLINEGAAVTIKGILKGETGAVIELVKGFAPIVLSGKVEGEEGAISLVSAQTLEDQQIFKTKIADLTVFDITGIIPIPEDGNYDYGYYVVGDKIYIKAYNIGVTDGDDVDATFATWKDAIAFINKIADKNADYEIQLLGDVNIGAALTLPVKNKYASLSVEGSGHSLTFTGTSLTITGDITISDVLLCPVKAGNVAVPTYKVSVGKGLSLTLDSVYSYSTFTLKAAVGGYISGEVEYPDDATEAK